uniref:hypothetical protein n=1 Tax=Desulfosarcina cetonica TaxID=90730 RepID=UPI001C44C5F0
AGPLEAQLADLSRASSALADDLKRRLARQTLWGGALEDLDRLPLPSMETLDRFEQQFAASLRRIESANAALATIDGEIDAATAELRRVDPAQIIPTEADLQAARTTRDRGWQMIRQTLAGNPPPADARAVFVARPV